ncbi:hypothetical protein D2T29_12350 [Sinirhodobacter populi]|uniref:Uncharacterized protein n=1 Tax=Paenirhodobacter populi TaxID=2306993 RepID=A0A443KCM6_9RHOB|nr:hypothetical protein [Sinirhodobacter populi]RWR30456.1 hypothetical protein D2T29_12350 [Sinirhodobacter populi]
MAHITAHISPMPTIKAFFLGVREFRLSCTWADPARMQGDDYTALDEAYDAGRELAHRLTFRHFDN